MPFAHVNGAEIFMKTAGRGRPLLLIHGSGLDHSFFQPWLDDLQRVATLVYVDLRGCGRSSALGEGFSGNGPWIDDLESLRLHLGLPRWVVLGHSYGGCLALEYALRHPKAIEGLVIDGGYPAFDYGAAIFERLKREGSPEQTEALTRILSNDLPDDASARAFYARMAPLYFHRWDPAYQARIFDPAIYRVEALNKVVRTCLPSFNVLGRLTEIDTPALILNGRHDWIVPPESGGCRVAAGIRGSELVIFERSGHWPCVEENEDYLAAIRRWLAALRV